MLRCQVCAGVALWWCCSPRVWQFGPLIDGLSCILADNYFEFSDDVIVRGTINMVRGNYIYFSGGHTRFMSNSELVIKENSSTRIIYFGSGVATTIASSAKLTIESESQPTLRFNTGGSHDVGRHLGCLNERKSLHVAAC